MFNDYIQIQIARNQKLHQFLNAVPVQLRARLDVDRKAKPKTSLQFPIRAIPEKGLVCSKAIPAYLKVNGKLISLI